METQANTTTVSDESKKNSTGAEDTARTFTQEQVNTFLAKQKNELKQRYADFDKYKEIADKYEAEKQNAMSTEDKLKAQIEDLTAQVAKIQAENEKVALEVIRERIASEFKVPSKYVLGETEGEMRSNATELAGLLVKKAGMPSPIGVEVEKSGNTAGSLNAGVEMYKKRHSKEE